MTSVTRNKYKPSLLEDVCRWLYTFVIVLIIPFAFLSLVRRGAFRNKEYNRRRFERFGLVPSAPSQNGYLFHCVSVGEVVAASCLIKQIMRDEPNTSITVTTTTPTGSARVNDIFGRKVHHFYLPYDLHMAMAGMIKRIKPKAVIITEVELWPNFIHACWKREIPVMVVNARMTDRSAKRYAKISLLFTPMLNKLSHVCAQGERDYKNYLMLGMPQAAITLTNNIKFDQAQDPEASTDSFMGIQKSSTPILVAGSTHEPEESVILNAVTILWETMPNLRLILVPRHPERFDAVAKLIHQNGLDYVRTSQISDIPSSAKIILLDEMGKLNNVYRVATFAFVGGSIADRGGHNALEPAAFSVPVLMGPNTYNNPVICTYLQQRGALSIVDNAHAIVQKCVFWVNSPEERLLAGNAGRLVIDENRGALKATINCLRSVIS